MGNTLGKNTYIAKDTFHPDTDIFRDCAQKDDPHDTAEVKSNKLKAEDALSITVDDKLKMVEKETGFLGPGETALFKMKNLATKKEGLVQSNAVAKVGTDECEK